MTNQDDSYGRIDKMWEIKATERKLVFVVANHNNTELGRFDNRQAAEKEARFYREQTGNPAYIDEHFNEVKP